MKWLTLVLLFANNAFAVDLPALYNSRINETGYGQAVQWQALGKNDQLGWGVENHLRAGSSAQTAAEILKRRYHFEKDNGKIYYLLLYLAEVFLLARNGYVYAADKRIERVATLLSHLDELIFINFKNQADWEPELLRDIFIEAKLLVPAKSILEKKRLNDYAAHLAELISDDGIIAQGLKATRIDNYRYTIKAQKFGQTLGRSLIIAGVILVIRSFDFTSFFDLVVPHFHIANSTPWFLVYESSQHSRPDFIDEFVLGLATVVSVGRGMAAEWGYQGKNRIKAAVNQCVRLLNLGKKP